jgi:hypothetical protein
MDAVLEPLRDQARGAYRVNPSKQFGLVYAHVTAAVPLCPNDGPVPATD